MSDGNGSTGSTPTERPVLIVTGGSRGIGRETCLLAARDNFNVVVNYLSNRAAANAVVSQIQAEGGVAQAIPADVRSEAEVQRLFATVVSTVGPIAALVNNAGIVEEDAQGADITAARFDRMIDANLRGPFFCMREAARQMLRNKTAGVIVNVSSYSVRTGGASYHIDYAAAKAGVEAMTVGFAKELAEDGIRVNAVAPGTTDTDMAAVFSGTRRAKIEKGIPMGRFARPAEIAECIVFLLSPRASYITGAIYGVNGGRR